VIPCPRINEKNEPKSAHSFLCKIFQYLLTTPLSNRFNCISRDAYLPLFEKEKELNEVIAQMGDATSEGLEVLLEKMGEIHDEDGMSKNGHKR
jgi:hypothetical protein